MNIRKGAVALAIVLAAIGAGSAYSAGQGWTVRFSFVPQRAYQGQVASVSVLVKPSNARCSLLVRYLDGTIQSGLGMTRAAAGHAAWSWELAQAAPAGPARAAVQCGRSSTVSRAFTVVGGTARHSKLSIVTSGYSQRPNRFGPGSSVSYGVVLDNPSDTEDAQSVTVQVNFIDAADHTIETTSTRIGAIAAASTFNLGGSQAFSTQTPVVKLEVVVQTDSFLKRAVHQPAVENIHIVPGSYEPDWVGAIDGDLVNDHPTDTLTNAQIYIVLYDAAGHVVGGGTGFLFATLPPGTRSHLNASFGFDAIPMDKASTAAISIVPSYKAAGA